MSIDVESLRGQRIDDAPNLGHVLAPHRCICPHGVCSRRPIDRLAPTDLVKVVGALKRFLLRHFHERPVNLLWRKRLTDCEPEDARIELPTLGKPSVRFIVLCAHPTAASVGPCCDPEGIEVGDEGAGVSEPGFLILQWDFARHEGHTAGPLYQTVDLTC